MLIAVTPYIQRYRERRRLATIPAQLAQDLDILAGALRAGSSFTQAIQITGRENEESLGEEWRILLTEMQRGASLRQALAHFEARVPIPPVRFFVSIVTIIQETGGNLAGVLSNLADTLRQEMTFQSKLRAMTAQGKLSGYVVSAMPFLIITVLAWLTPDLIRPLFVTTLGWMMLGGVVLLVTIGTWMIQKIVTIDV